jgi:Mn2+/Fe2+ NRAMP family transporter
LERHPRADVSDPMRDHARTTPIRSPERAADHPRGGVFRALGLGVVTGACDDDPCAIGTYASAGAKFGPSFLWTAPITFPMMYAVVYLSAKLGQVTGKGLFDNLKDHYPRWLLWPTLVGVLIGNTVEAGADLGGMAAATNQFVPVPIWLFVVGNAAIILAGTVKLAGDGLRAGGGPATGPG